MAASEPAGMVMMCARSKPVRREVDSGRSMWMPDFATKPLLKRKQIMSRMTAFMNGAANIQGLWRGRLE
jgi:hypothetical protein